MSIPGKISRNSDCPYIQDFYILSCILRAVKYMIKVKTKGIAINGSKKKRIIQQFMGKLRQPSRRHGQLSI